MRLCVTCVYWTLLLVSVISSGLLFLIVASEGTVISDKPRGISQEDNIPVENVARETIGADEIASLEPKIPESNPRPTVKTEREHLHLEEKHDGNTPIEENFVKDTKSEKNLDLLKESLTQQPNLSQGISETGQSVVLTLVDTATAELQSLAEPRLTDDVRPRSSTKNTTLTTTTTRSDATTTAAINLNGESHKFVESHKDTLPAILLETIETSTNFTEGSLKEESGVKEAQSIEDEAPIEQQVVVVRAEQKVADEGPTRIEDPQEDQSKDEARKKEEDSVTSAELDDGAARARIVGGSADEASAAILDGLVTSGPTDHHQEDIPSFSEWAQKRLEEAEKKKTHPNASIQNPGGPGRGVGGMKVRSKNYASPDCGAKIVAVNPEARSARSVLVSTRDEYMLNTCTSRVWFVVELCEAIQAKKIELANFELFSSSPKDFSVHVSDRFPTREWSPVGQFTGKDQRDVQSFHLNPQLFGKFIKVEFHSHYGSEHFCPISLFRAYGTSEFEVLETETDHQDNDDDDDDDEDEDDPLDSESGGDSRNLFGSARDAVLNIVKKAAEVLVKTNDPSNKNNITKIQESIEDNIMRSSFATCMTPRYTINCANCTDLRFAGVFELLSCRSGHLDATLKIPFVNEALNSRELCGFYGVDVVNTSGMRIESLDDETVSKTKFLLARNLRASFLAAIFSPEYVVALCNVVATKDRKLVLNTSYEIVGNVSANSSTRIDGNVGKFDTAEIGGQPRGATSNCSPDVDVGGCKTATLARETKVTRGLGTSVVRQQEPTTSKPTETTTTTMESIAAQIKPTKTLSREDMRKESSVPVLEPSKDPNEESLQAEVMTTPSPIVNVPTATTKMAQEPSVGDDAVETTGQIVTPMASVTSGQAGREIQDSAMHEAGHDNGTPMKHEIGDGEIKQGKLDNGEHETKLTPQEQMSLDSIFSDLKDLDSDGIHGGNIHNANIVAQPTASTTPQQKESVFLRLSNRIKALERNMSLSGQYLEELSKRYKKQVEEMQRSLERATAAMSEESRKGEERELRRIEEISALRDEINSLTKSMEIILYDRNSWRGKLSTLCQHFALIVVEVVVLILAVSYCRRSSEFDQADVPRAGLENGEATRRRSAGTMSASATKKPRTRRPSEIASKIVDIASTETAGVDDVKMSTQMEVTEDNSTTSSTYGDLMIDDRANQETRKDKKKRRKAKTNGDSRKEISRSDEGMPGGTALPSRRSSSIDPPSSSHEKKLALCHSRPRPDSAPEYTGGWFDRPTDLSINEKPEEPEEESPEECSNRQRRPADGTVVADLPTDGKEEQDSKNRSGIFRTGGILKAAKLPSPSFMKTALGSRMKRNSRENRAGEQTAHLRSDNWEWHSINSSNRSDRSGSESPSGAGATNGHRGNPSDDSGSSSATNTPAGNKRQKKSAGGIRKMVRKLF